MSDTSRSVLRPRRVIRKGLPCPRRRRPSISDIHTRGPQSDVDDGPGGTARTRTPLRLWPSRPRTAPWRLAAELSSRRPEPSAPARARASAPADACHHCRRALASVLASPSDMSFLGYTVAAIVTVAVVLLAGGVSGGARGGGGEGDEPTGGPD